MQLERLALIQPLAALAPLLQLGDLPQLLLGGAHLPDEGLLPLGRSRRHGPLLELGGVDHGYSTGGSLKSGWTGTVWRFSDFADGFGSTTKQFF